MVGPTVGFPGYADVRFVRSAVICMPDLNIEG